MRNFFCTIRKLWNLRRKKKFARNNLSAGNPTPNRWDCRKKLLRNQIVYLLEFMYDSLKLFYVPNQYNKKTIFKLRGLNLTSELSYLESFRSSLRSHTFRVIRNHTQIIYKLCVFFLQYEEPENFGLGRRLSDSIFFNEHETLHRNFPD